MTNAYRPHATVMFAQMDLVDTHVHVREVGLEQIVPRRRIFVLTTHVKTVQRVWAKVQITHAPVYQGTVDPFVKFLQVVLLLKI